MRDRDRRGFGDGVLRGTTAGPTNGSNGVHPEDMRTRPVPFDEVIDDPIDLVAVQADDELINALAAGMAVSAPGFGGYDRDDQVVAMLAAWKAEIDAEPIPQLLDTDTAVRAAVAGRPSSRRARHLVPLASAAALIVIAVTGVSLGANVAQPGDTLWGVTKVLHSDRAESVEAAVDVQSRLERVRTALATGQTEVAREELAAVEADLGEVRMEEGFTELAQAQEFLEAKLEETPPGTPTDPIAPLTRLPSPAPRTGTTDPADPSVAVAPDSPNALETSEADGSTGPADGTSTSPQPSTSPAASDDTTPTTSESTAPTPTPTPTGTGEAQPDPTPTPPLPLPRPELPVGAGTAEGTVDETTTAIGSAAISTTSDATS